MDVEIAVTFVDYDTVEVTFPNWKDVWKSIYSEVVMGYPSNPVSFLGCWERKEELYILF